MIFSIHVPWNPTKISEILPTSSPLASVVETATSPRPPGSRSAESRHSEVQRPAHSGAIAFGEKKIWWDVKVPILVYQIYHIWEKYLPISILVQISYLLIIYIERERDWNDISDVRMWRSIPFWWWRHIDPCLKAAMPKQVDDKSCIRCPLSSYVSVFSEAHFNLSLLRPFKSKHMMVSGLNYTIYNLPVLWRW